MKKLYLSFLSLFAVMFLFTPVASAANQATISIKKGQYRVVSKKVYAKKNYYITVSGKVYNDRTICVNLVKNKKKIDRDCSKSTLGGDLHINYNVGNRTGYYYIVLECWGNSGEGRNKCSGKATIDSWR
jgi:serine protease inhibitor ecotin